MALELGCCGFVSVAGARAGVRAPPPPVGDTRDDGFGRWWFWRTGRMHGERFSGGGLRLAASGEKGASLRTGEELRTQLDQLQAEAEDARSKANGTRLRLLRLSDAAKRLQKQAALNVQSGREDEAREMLFQKKKIMNALEKTKKRIELFDQLSRKLSEAISLTESELIGNVASQPPVSLEDTDTPVWMVSPKASLEDESGGGEILVEKTNSTEDTKEVEPEMGQVSDSMYVEPVQSASKAKSGTTTLDESNINFLTSITSYKAFLEHVDERLRSVENDLIVVLRLSNLITGSEQRENTNTKQTSEILQDIRSIRDRIAGIIQSVPDLS